MSMTDIGVILTFIIGLGNIVYNIANHRKTQFINTVTASRIKWIGELRTDVVKFTDILLIDKANFFNIERDSKTGREISFSTSAYYDLNLLNKSFHKINLMLNGKGDIDNDIVKKIIDLKNYAYQYNLCCDICNSKLGYAVKIQSLHMLDENTINEIFIKCNTISEYDSGKYDNKVDYLDKEFIYAGAHRIYDFILEILNTYFKQNIENEVKNLITLLKEYLKREWERVKLESKKGDIIYELESSDGIQFDKICHIRDIRNWDKYKAFNKNNLEYKFKKIIGWIIIILVIMLSLKVIFDKFIQDGIYNR